jgi:septal ring factor EnvC (AmiA/AmiB activator)
MVMIDHGNGYQTLYGHMSGVTVQCGQSIGKARQSIQQFDRKLDQRTCRGPQQRRFINPSSSPP